MFCSELKAKYGYEKSKKSGYELTPYTDGGQPHRLHTDRRFFFFFEREAERERERERKENRHLPLIYI